MNAKRIWQVLIALTVIGAVGVAYSLNKPSGAATVAGHDATELTAKKSRLVRSTVARGLIKPKVGAEVKVGSQVSGIVKRMLVSVGEQVTRGQVLAELDASVELAQIDTIKAQINVDKVQLSYAKRELDRLLRLSTGNRGNLISEQAIDDQRQKAEASAAELQRVEAQLKEAEVTLGYTQIKAPIDGTIASISTYKGETVAASFSAPTFVMIIDLSRLEVQAYVDEADIGSVHVAQNVDFTMEGYPNRTLHGAVRAINPKPEVTNGVVNYVVIIDFEQPGDIVIRPEMTTHVDFVLEARDDALVVSSRALIREDGADFVAVKRSGRWKKISVKTGLRDSGKIEIVSGLQEGDTYLADKNEWKVIASE